MVSTEPDPEPHPFHDEWSFQRRMSAGNPVASKPIAPDQPCFDCGVPFAEHNRVLPGYLSFGPDSALRASMSTEPDPEPLTAEDERELRRIAFDVWPAQSIEGPDRTVFFDAIRRLLATLDRERNQHEPLLDELMKFRSATPSSVTPDLAYERATKALDSLDVIDGIVDDTHPEGDGCPLCHELDNLREVIEAMRECASVTPSEPTLNFRDQPVIDAANDIRANHAPNEWDSCVTCRKSWPCDAELLAELVLTRASLRGGPA